MPDEPPNPNKRPREIAPYDFGDKLLAGGLVIGAIVGCVYLILNDATGVGIFDDAAIAPLGKIIWDNYGIIFS